MDIVYVDDKDKEIGFGSIQGAYDKGIVVRIARVFLVNDKGDLLIQKRSDNHRALPGRWDQTAAGHVDKGENYEQAAYRELMEEMGIDNVKLRQVLNFYTEENDDIGFTKKRFNSVYEGVFNGTPEIDNDEVSDYRWVSFANLTQEMTDKPDNFTEGFIRAYEAYKNV